MSLNQLASGISGVQFAKEKENKNWLLQINAKASCNYPLNKSYIVTLVSYEELRLY
ncbi:hypothetical protein [Solibacillus sp. FSL K6-1554]|uniref:hypothetical protein n=1 Tax=Solibacillus sp. FSL K6-1554 TaxID=2921472 RepID=UPI0030FBEE92